MQIHVNSTPSYRFQWLYDRDRRQLQLFFPHSFVNDGDASTSGFAMVLPWLPVEIGLKLTEIGEKEMQNSLQLSK